MKRFLRSKLVLRLAAIVTIAAIVAVPLSGNITRSYAASAATVLSENFETGAPGWTMTGFWHIQDHPESISVKNPDINPDLVTLPDSGQLPAAYSGTHAAWFGDASTGTFCGSDFNTITQAPKDGCTSTQVQSGELTSPAFSLAGASSAEVQFQAWWEIESVNADTYDLMTVEYSVDGGANWQQAGKLNPVNNPAGNHDQDYTDNGVEKPSQWSQDIVDLSGAAGQSNVQIRFRFDTVDDLYQGFRGWLVDNVVISTPFASPSPSIASLNPACVSSSASLPITITGSNFVSGSRVLLDGNDIGGAVLSAQTIEFTANSLAAGNHTVQVVSPNGAKSNTVTLTSALSCSTQSNYVAFGDSLTTGYSIPTCHFNQNTSPWGCNGTRPATPYADKVAQTLGYSYSDNPSVYTSAAPNLPLLGLARVGIWGYTAQQAVTDYNLGHDSTGAWDTQLDAITKARGLVTGELGVNDLHFSDVSYWSKPMIEDFELGTNQVTTNAQKILNSKAVSSALNTLFAKLEIAKANGATVVITLVYNPYGSNLFHPCLPVHDGAAELVNTLDAVLKARALADGFLVADFRPAFNGHGAGDSNPYTFGTDCSIGSALWDWVPTWLGNNHSVTAANNNVEAKFDPHPNDKGTTAMANAILGVLK